MLVAAIDDNTTNLTVYRNLLSNLPDLTVETFLASTDALRWCASVEPDLIIVDYRMPAPNGLEFIQAYRGLHPASQAPIVMVTGERDREVRRRALDLGASDFLNKPADPVEFLARVRNLLALRESRRHLENRAAWLASEVARATEQIANREQETIIRLMRAAEFRDNETGTHIKRMGYYARLLGTAAGLADDDVELLFLAAPMHDIGKVSTPDRILLKPGKLEPDEWDIMRRHTDAGYRILAGSETAVLQLAAEIALRHHERWDGTGYPGRIQGTDTPIAARIAAVGDVFDALISVRPYKPAWTHDAAFAELQKRAGSHLDPLLVAQFIENRGEVIAIARRFTDDVAA